MQKVLKCIVEMCSPNYSGESSDFEDQHDPKKGRTGTIKRRKEQQLKHKIAFTEKSTRISLDDDDNENSRLNDFSFRKRKRSNAKMSFGRTSLDPKVGTGSWGGEEFLGMKLLNASFITRGDIKGVFS